MGNTFPSLFWGLQYIDIDRERYIYIYMYYVYIYIYIHTFNFTRTYARQVSGRQPQSAAVSMGVSEWRFPRQAQAPQMAPAAAAPAWPSAG